MNEKTDQAPAPREPASYRHRDALRLGNVAGTGLSTGLLVWVLTQVTGIDQRVTAIGSQIADQSALITSIHHDQDELRRQLESSRLEIGARLAACEARGIAHTARIEELERLSATCRAAIAAAEAVRARRLAPAASESPDP